LIQETNLERGWVLGSQEFRGELLAQPSEKRGWSEADLSRRRKGDSQKVRMALRLREEATMTLVWIARGLQMGTKTHSSHFALLGWAEEGGLTLVNDTKSRPLSSAPRQFFRLR